MSIIPPTASLVRYDNPVLVTRNTDKRGPKVKQFPEIMILFKA
jgi:hypothetical protein